MVTAESIDLQNPGRLVPPRESISADPAPRSWLLALAIHGGVAALLAGGIAAPKPQPESPPVFEIVIPAESQPAAQPAIPQPAPVEPLAEAEPQIAAPAPVKPVVKSRPPRPIARTHAEAPADSAPVATGPAAAAAPTAAAPALPQPQTETVQAVPPSYAPVLLDWLGRYRDYPRAARLRGQEGAPRIALTLDRSGRLLRLDLTQPSGHGLLDQAALDMARRAAPFPPPQLPPGSDTATFVVPVVFRLDR